MAAVAAVAAGEVDAVRGDPNAVTRGEYSDVGDGHLSLEAI